MAEIFLRIYSSQSCWKGWVEESSSWLGVWLSSILILSLGRLLALKLIQLSQTIQSKAVAKQEQ